MLKYDKTAGKLGLVKYETTMASFKSLEMYRGFALITGEYNGKSMVFIGKQGSDFPSSLTTSVKLSNSDFSGVPLDKEVVFYGKFTSIENMKKEVDKQFVDEMVRNCYIDISAELYATGASREEILKFINEMPSMHPLKRDLSYCGLSQDLLEITKQFRDLIVFQAPQSSSLFLVHPGALESFRKVFRIPDRDWGVDKIHDRLRRGEIKYDNTDKIVLSNVEWYADQVTSIYRRVVETSSPLAEAQIVRPSFRQQNLDKLELFSNVLNAELQMRKAAAESR